MRFNKTTNEQSKKNEAANVYCPMFSMTRDLLWNSPCWTRWVDEALKGIYANFRTLSARNNISIQQHCNNLLPNYVNLLTGSYQEASFLVVIQEVIQEVHLWPASQFAGGGWKGLSHHEPVLTSMIISIVLWFCSNLLKKKLRCPATTKITANVFCVKSDSMHSLTLIKSCEKNVIIHYSRCRLQMDIGANMHILKGSNW